MNQSFHITVVDLFLFFFSFFVLQSFVHGPWQHITWTISAYRETISKWLSMNCIWNCFAPSFIFQAAVVLPLSKKWGDERTNERDLYNKCNMTYHVSLLPWRNYWMSKRSLEYIIQEDRLNHSLSLSLSLSLLCSAAVRVKSIWFGWLGACIYKISREEPRQTGANWGRCT